MLEVKIQCRKSTATCGKTPHPERWKKGDNVSSKMSANGLHQLMQPHRFRVNDSLIEGWWKSLPKAEE